jgi:hypothetical protein
LRDAGARSLPATGLSSEQQRSGKLDMGNINWKLIAFWIALWWFVYSAPTEGPFAGFRAHGIERIVEPDLSVTLDRGTLGGLLKRPMWPIDF